MWLLTLFARRWWWTTLLVIAACAVLVRLGVWQLDRLEQRQAFNERVQAQLESSMLQLDASNLDLDLHAMEYRTVEISGTYDFGGEVGLRNQVWRNQPGIHLVTPLRIEGSDVAVLVDRGWIPAEDTEPGQWRSYAEPGPVIVRGVLRRSTTSPEIGFRTDPTPAAGEPPRKLWHLLNVELIGSDVSYEVLPVYVQKASDPAITAPPYPSEPDLDLTEGPHLGYAGQWFMFALVLALGYPFYVRKSVAEAEAVARMNGALNRV